MPSSGVSVEASITGSQITDNFQGIVGAAYASDGTIKATITGSIVAGVTGGYSIYALGDAAFVTFIVDDTEVAGNHYGLVAAGGAGEILMRNSSVFANTAAIATYYGGQIYSYGNNVVTGNTTNGTFTGTYGMQ